MTHDCKTFELQLVGDDPISADDAARARDCAECASLVGLTETLGAIGTARAVVEPGPGFASRAAVGARAQRVRRARVRTFGIATAAVAGGAAAALLWASPAGTDASRPRSAHNESAPAATTGGGASLTGDDDDAGDLWLLTGDDDALEISADWDTMQEPLAPYALLLEEDL